MPGQRAARLLVLRRAKAQGSANVPGVCDPAVDALIEKVITAQDRPTLQAAAHALDRVLLWRWYMVPN